ncbi:src-like-adapter 2 isoform X2 [Felis catus]|uniref:src-like-adapter 2 isoform X2 n=1 Tax=Felis catus TaxID=9685 RepID=UPI001D1A255F|nr:src-like-adapter 2 isoform X2 [Felis catus]
MKRPWPSFSHALSLGPGCWISLDPVLLSGLLRNDGRTAQQRENPAKPKLKPLCPRPRPCAHASRDGDWSTVVSEVSGTEYNIPSIHVAKISHGWLYEGLSREKAEELLLLPGNPGGAFLIRESQTRRGFYSLSVRLSRPASWDRIRHYRIQRLDNGWLYISPRLTFPSLQALVDHYSELADDICCLLKEPCALRRAGSLPGKPIPPPVIVQRTPLNWKELDSSLLFSEAPGTGEASLLSEGLRDALSSYISLTDDSSLDDARDQSRDQKGIQGCGT